MLNLRFYMESEVFLLRNLIYHQITHLYICKRSSTQITDIYDNIILSKLCKLNNYYKYPNPIENEIKSNFMLIYFKFG